MPRLFVAIDLPPRVKTVLAELSPELPGVRWVSQQELHLTLRFLGEVSEANCSTVKGALSSVGFASFPLAIRGVGHFPPTGHPRVLWVGLTPCQELLQLQLEIERVLNGVDVPAEQRRFSPHVTLARLKDTPVAALNRFETRHVELACPSFEASEFILYASTLSRQGAIHSKEAVYPCRQTSASSPNHR